ncbi:phage tail termination protein [Mycobacterium malmoense]|uniref:phage tail termination protein n=1 Tax=Mycobacterium malmoense TaxID=1780 RepID=UPI003F74CC3A
MITYPSWWKGGYPDIEVVLDTLFESPQVGLGGVQVVNWLPPANTYESVLSSGQGYLRTYRTGGKINYDQKRDEPRAQIAALTRSRDASWELIEFVRQILDAFQKGGVVPGTTTSIELAGEVVGPQLIPELIQDDRLVPVTFEFHVPKPKGLPNYRLQLGI